MKNDNNEKGKMKKIKLVIFDCYGVVLYGGYPPTMKALAERFGGDWKDYLKVFYTKYFNMAAEREITQKEAWVNAINEMGLDIDWKEVRDMHYGFMSRNEKIFSLVDKLKKKCDVLLLSKNTPEQFNDTDKILNFAKHFDCVINTWDLQLPKASVETHEHIMKKYGIKADEIIYIDDQEDNLVPAKELGEHTIFYSGDKHDDFLQEFNKMLKAFGE